MFLNREKISLNPGFDEYRARELYRCVPVQETRDARIGPTELVSVLERKDPEFWTRQRVVDYVGELKKHGLVWTVQKGAVYRLPRGQDGFSERDLYAPMMDEIRSGWATEAGRDYHREHRFCEVVDTSEGGSRPDGSWRRPDITLIGGKEIPYLPGNFVDVVTFEVKRGITLIGVYEALAHQRAANFSYVVYWFPEIWGTPDRSAMVEIEAEARRCGVGVIVARQEDDYGCWQELVQPNRVDRDPQVIEGFLKTQCQPVLNGLLEWINRPPVEHPPIKGPPTDDDFKRLKLSNKEQAIARAIYDELKDGGKGWTYFRHALNAPVADTVIRKVRNAMRDKGFIRTSQGGGLYIRHSGEPHRTP